MKRRIIAGALLAVAGIVVGACAAPDDGIASTGRPPSTLRFIAPASSTSAAPSSGTTAPTSTVPALMGIATSGVDVVIGAAAPAPAPSATTTVTSAGLTAVAVVAPKPGDAVRTPSGVLAFWKGVDEQGRAHVSTPCTREASVARADRVAGVDVLLDAGHGGLDPGARSPTGVTEAELNLDVVLRARDALVARGFTVAVTRDGNWFRTVGDRGTLAAALQPRAFVSVHHNSGADAPSRNGPGTEVYYQRAGDGSRRLGGLVWEEVVGAFSQFDIRWTGGGNRGVRWRQNTKGQDFYGVLRNSDPVPAIILEAAYLSGSEEAKLIRTNEFRDAEAQAVARGIERWLTTDAPGSGYRNGIVANGPSNVPNLARCVDPPLE
ncbi:MAG TPA: N-acetylmuramoyl-L-alanine amidase [Acidimicrobiales bacterium]|jgi:N-acetylmuramoyl-L-alanine amidase|nr:N-acetylmuramoyl-L-alanine amidase [Acidimicrobiales bacterium]